MNNDITSGGPLIKKATGKLATVEQQIAVSTGLPDGKQPRSQGDEDFASLLAPQSDAVAADSPAQIGLANGAKQKKIDTNFEQEDGVMPPLPPDEPEVLDTIPSTGNSRLHTLSKDTLEFAGVDGTSKKNNTSEQLFTLIAPKETTLVDHRFRKTDTHSDLPNQLAKVGSESGTQTSCHPEILPTQIRAADSVRNSLQSVATQARDSERPNIPLASAQQLQTTTASSTSLTNNSAQAASARSSTLQSTGVKGKNQVHANGATLIKVANTATPASKIDQQTTAPVDAQSRPSPPRTQEFTAPTDKQASSANVPHLTHKNANLAAHAPNNNPLTHNRVTTDLGQSALFPAEMHEVLSWDPARLSTTANAPAAPARADLLPHVARQLIEVMAQASQRPVEIALSPQELGRVRMSVQTEDGAVVINIIAERADTLDLMRRHIDQLGQSFRAMGYESISFAFGYGSDTGAQADGNNDSPSNGPSNSDEAAAPPANQHEPVLIQLDRLPKTGVDIRL